ncbi:hypothetical protein [Arenimonas alkanexedens]
MIRWYLPLLALLTATACSKPEPATAEAAAPVAPVAAEPVVPAEPTPATREAEQALARNDPEVINFEGFGPAKFGTDEEQVRMSWGHPLEGEPNPADGPKACYYLTMDPPPETGSGIAFMFEEGGFKRYDVDVAAHVAPGDFTIGARADDVLAKFAGRVEAMPHEYVEGGRYLVVTPAQGGDARLVFEVDAQGLVSEWRIGLLPQVLYTEGCS